MQGRYNEHCLGLRRQALILHDSHRELGPFRATEDPCYHSPCEVLTLPQFSYGRPASVFFFHQKFPPVKKIQGSFLLDFSPKLARGHKRQTLEQFFGRERSNSFLVSLIILAVKITAEPGETQLA